MFIFVHFEDDQPAGLSDLLQQFVSQRMRHKWNPTERVLHIGTMGRDVAADVLQKILLGSDIAFERIEIRRGTDLNEVQS